MAVRTDTARPGAGGERLGARSRSPARGRARWWLELLVVAWLGWVYDMITNLAPLRAHVALAHGGELLSLERSLHLNVELALNEWLAARHTLGLILSDYYDNAHFVVTLGVLGWLWWKRADIYRPLRSALVLINIIGLAVFWLYPTAPPRLLPGSGFTDVVASTHAFGGWHTGSLATAANQFAAMPSLHVAWAVWSAVALWRLSRHRPVRALAALHPLLTTFAVFATGNHYVLDALAGALTCALALALVGLLYAEGAPPGARESDSVGPARQPAPAASEPAAPAE